MNITVLRGESSDLLMCQEPNTKPFCIAVPSGSADGLRSAADWERYFANGTFSDPAQSLRAAKQPTQAPDGYGVALERRRGNVTAITSSARFATGHTGSPDGYSIALGNRATVHSFPAAAVPDGYATALARRKES